MQPRRIRRSRLHVVSLGAVGALSQTHKLIKISFCSSDDIENKSGFNNAINFINEQMTTFFRGKELPLTKKVFDQLANWVEKQRTKMENASRSDTQISADGAEEGAETGN